MVEVGKFHVKGAQLFFGNKRPKEANVGVTEVFGLWVTTWSAYYLNGFSGGLFFDNWNCTFCSPRKKNRLSSIILSEDLVAPESKSKRKIKYRRQKLKSVWTRRLQLCCKNSVNINDDNKPAQGRVINGLENCISVSRVTIQLLKSAILGTSVFSE